MSKKTDGLWKLVLEDTFEDFLRFLNPDVDTVLDLEKGFEFLDTELPQTYMPEDNKYQSKMVDKLVKVCGKDGKMELVLVHIEVQEQYRSDFSKRMFGYYYRLFDKYDMPITAYAIFLEPNMIERPNSFEQNFMGTSLVYKFNTLKIADRDYDELMANENPFALAILAAKSAHLVAGIENKEERDKCLLAYKRRLFRLLMSRNMPGRKIKSLMKFLNSYINFDNRELDAKFEQEENSLIINNGKNMGIIEGLTQMYTEEAEKLGWEKDKARLAGKLIGGFYLTVEQIADLVELPVSQVKELKYSLDD